MPATATALTAHTQGSLRHGPADPAAVSRAIARLSDTDARAEAPQLQLQRSAVGATNICADVSANNDINTSADGLTCTHSGVILDVTPNAAIVTHADASNDDGYTLE